MGKAPCCSKVGLHKGPWSTKEDMLLTNYIQAHGEGQWRSLPKKAGLLRCGKSCRLRWMNYLRPGIKRGNITADEEDLIIRLHSLLGNRWSLIAGRLPGRTDNEIKNHWNTHLIKRLKNAGIEPKPSKTTTKRPPKESKRKAKAAAAPETETAAATANTNRRKKQKKNTTIEGHDTNDAAAKKIKTSTIEDDDTNNAAVKKIKLYVPKPIRFCPGFSSNNTVDSALSSSSSHEEVNNKAKEKAEKEVRHFDEEAVAVMPHLDWPLMELGDANYSPIQVCIDDHALIEGCDFSFHDSIPTIGSMLEQVYDEYLQLL